VCQRQAYDDVRERLVVQRWRQVHCGGGADPTHGRRHGYALAAGDVWWPMTPGRYTSTTWHLTSSLALSRDCAPQALNHDSAQRAATRQRRFSGQCKSLTDWPRVKRPTPLGQTTTAISFAELFLKYSLYGLCHSVTAIKMYFYCSWPAIGRLKVGYSRL